MTRRPALVGILNDFGNLAMLVLNTEPRVLLAETPQTLRQRASERPEVNSQAITRAECPATRAALPPVPRAFTKPTFAHTSCLHFQSGQTLQRLKGKPEQQPKCISQEKAMLRSWSGVFGAVSVTTEVRSSVPAGTHVCPVPLHYSDNRTWLGPFSARDNVCAARETLRDSDALDL